MPPLKDAVFVFALGFLGGIFVEFYRVYSLAHSNSFQFDKKFYLISLIHAIGGGLVSIPLTYSLPWSAIFTGISAPMLFSAIAGRTVGEIYKLPLRHRTVQVEIARIETLNEINSSFLSFLSESDLDGSSKSSIETTWSKYVDNQNSAFETRFGYELGKGSGLGFLGINLANYGYYLYGLFEKPWKSDD